MADAAFADPAIRLAHDRKVSADPAARRKALRNRLFLGFGVLLVLAGLAYGSWWYIVGQRYISTDDAYVNADSAQITPQINGTVSEVARSATRCT